MTQKTDLKNSVAIPATVPKRAPSITGGKNVGGIMPARFSSAYMRGGRGVTFAGWRPAALRENQDDISSSWDLAAARVTDIVHNSGWISGAIEQCVANTVGLGLRLKALPENNTFGMTNTEAAEWAKLVEQRFELWARTPQECDIQGQRTFGQMQVAAFRTWLLTGEILSQIVWKKRPWNICGTKVRILPPQRLSRKSEQLKRLVNGVFLDQDGMPIGYLITRKTQFNTEERRVAARDNYGRPNVVHVFEGVPETYRGISPLVPALQVAKQFDQLADATLTAAIVQSLFAGVITSDAVTEEAMDALLTGEEQTEMAKKGQPLVSAAIASQESYYVGADFNIGMNGRIAQLYPGDKFEFQTPTIPGGSYKDFSQNLLHELARCLGMTYESTTGDNQGATYSSLQASSTEIYAITTARRKNIVSPFCQPIYEAWLEEEIERGDIPFPGGIDAFLTNRAAACRAEWRGAPRPTPDELKRARAFETLMRMGVTSASVICNEHGLDYEDVCQQLAAEADLRGQYGLPEPFLTQAGGASQLSAQGDHDRGQREEKDDDID